MRERREIGTFAPIGIPDAVYDQSYSQQFQDHGDYDTGCSVIPKEPSDECAYTAENQQPKGDTGQGIVHEIADDSQDDPYPQDDLGIFVPFIPFIDGLAFFRRSIRFSGNVRT